MASQATCAEVEQKWREDVAAKMGHSPEGGVLDLPAGSLKVKAKVKCSQGASVADGQAAAKGVLVSNAELMGKISKSVASVPGIQEYLARGCGDVGLTPLGLKTTMHIEKRVKKPPKRPLPEHRLASTPIPSAPLCPVREEMPLALDSIPPLATSQVLSPAAAGAAAAVAAAGGASPAELGVPPADLGAPAQGKPETKIQGQPETNIEQGCSDDMVLEPCTKEGTVLEGADLELHSAPILAASQRFPQGDTETQALHAPTVEVEVKALRSTEGDALVLRDALCSAEDALVLRDALCSADNGNCMEEASCALAQNDPVGAAVEALCQTQTLAERQTSKGEVRFCAAEEEEEARRLIREQQELAVLVAEVTLSEGERSLAASIVQFTGEEERQLQESLELVKTIKAKDEVAERRKQSEMQKVLDILARYQPLELSGTADFAATPPQLRPVSSQDLEEIGVGDRVEVVSSLYMNQEGMEVEVGWQGVVEEVNDGDAVILFFGLDEGRYVLREDFGHLIILKADPFGSSSGATEYLGGACVDPLHRNEQLRAQNHALRAKLKGILGCSMVRSVPPATGVDATWIPSPMYSQQYQQMLMGSGITGCIASTIDPSGQLCSEAVAAAQAGRTTPDWRLNPRAAAFIPADAQDPEKLADIQEKEAKEADDKPRTTVILRNLPEEYSRASLLDLLIKKGFGSAITFLYMPMDFRKETILGYAFVDLALAEIVPVFWKAFDGFADWETQSENVCTINWSESTQGLQANIERYRNSSVMHDTVPDEYKPMLFKDGMRIPFAKPTQTVRLPRVRDRTIGLQSL